jgi:hypothetical protein
MANGNPEARNFEAISKAKAQHNKTCPFPPTAVRMNPFEIERMGWDEGDTIAGLLLEADGKIGTGTFRLVCDGMEPPELEIEQTDAISAPAEPVVVPVGPVGPGRFPGELN